MQFKLSVTLGNDAMDSPTHLGDALEKVAHTIAERYAILESDMSGRVFDANGNAVGAWSVE